jgi:hypothetical protein
LFLRVIRGGQEPEQQRWLLGKPSKYRTAM